MRHLGVVLLLAPLTLAIGTPSSRAEEEFTPSEELSALLLAPGDDGEPLISPREREYFDGLPPRAKELFEEAIEKTAAALSLHLGDSFGLFSCSKATNETNYIAQKFARLVMGSNNVDSCNRT